jgi:hypothetical protein
LVLKTTYGSPPGYKPFGGFSKSIFRNERPLLPLPVAPSLRTPLDLSEGLAADPPRESAYESLLDLPVRRTQTGDLPVPDPLIV